MPRGIMMLVGVMLYGALVVLFSASPLVLAVDGFDGGHRLCHVRSHALVQTVIQSTHRLSSAAVRSRSFT